MANKICQDLPDSNHRFRPYMIYVWLIFSLSLLPILIAILHSTYIHSALVKVFPQIEKVDIWYSSKVEKVEEMRILSPYPTKWYGNWYNVNENYANFERWFNDNMGLRDFFIRAKNELDFRLFRSSSRVYYGKDNYIYGRNLIDNELPATERVMSSAEEIKKIINGMKLLSDNLKDKGITTYFITPMQKEYFIDNKLPFFAPKILKNSQFMQFYRDILNDPDLNVIDVYHIIKSIPKEYRSFYTQDFHWNHLSAFMVSQSVVDKIAVQEQSATRWNYKFEVVRKPFLGSDARFSSRLIAQEHVDEPTIRKTWVDKHTVHLLNANNTGLEFETDIINDEKLLPKTCMYGNSFSDSMLDIGIINFFSKFTKLNRTVPVSKIPQLIDGRCKYLIIQILDIQSNTWSLFKKPQG